jgi:hypothetical protein
MVKRMLTIVISLICFTLTLYAQETDSVRIKSQLLDSLYIQEVQDAEGKLKLLHAEPLYIDLIRDLGARKGEKEWNFGLGLTDKRNFEEYEFLVEYEWAPIDRLGLEVELPLFLNIPVEDFPREDTPSSRVESLKMAFQYTFLVSEKAKTSLAIGGINELLFSDLNNFGRPVFQGNLYNPFLVAAKRWGSNYHTLIYTGPRFEKTFADQSWHFGYEWHTNFHYMIPGTRNFVGLEINKYWEEGGSFDATLRPQIRVGIAENFLIGLVTGIPIISEADRFSMFTRIIWEPMRNHKRH